MKRFLTVAAAMLALTGMGQVAMRKLEDLTNTNLVCVTDYGPQLVSVTGGLASISGAVAVHTNRTDNPHGVTAAQVGALTAEADPVAGPRLDLIEPETNKWNAAYGWGDHALAGYLLPADLAPYATTQQVEAAAAALAAHQQRQEERPAGQRRDHADRQLTQHARDRIAADHQRRAAEQRHRHQHAVIGPHRRAQRVRRSRRAPRAAPTASRPGLRAAP